MKMGFRWTELDELDPREIRMIMALSGALASKEQGFG